MALVVPNEGEAEMLKRIVGQTNTDLVVRLFGNDITPDENSVFGDFVYTSVTAYGASNSLWVISGDPTEASYPQMSFVFEAGETVYGYFVHNAEGDKVLWAERFVDGPYVVPPTGGTVYVTPKIQLA